MVIFMLEKVVLFIALVMLFIAVFCIFNARGIVKSKVKEDKLNRTVTIVKIVGAIFAINSLIAIYFIRRIVMNEENDTVKLLKECDAGAKMGIEGINGVMDKAPEIVGRNIIAIVSPKTK